MIHASNELILGIELREEYAQITYYHQSVKEPLTLAGVQGTDQYQLPMALRQGADGRWQLWDGAPQMDGEDRDICRISDLFGKIFRQEPIRNGNENIEPARILSVYFQLCLAQLKLLTQNTKVQVMVTVKELTEELGEVIAEALVGCGIDRKQIYVQDYLSSFYYYTVNQKKELWYQDVALLTYEEEAIVGYILHIDRSTKPALATAEKIARQPMDDSVRAGRSDQDWNREKDRLFFELLKKVFERRTVSVSYLMGDYFNKSWAERSIQYLCYKRHAFQGMNLYSKGACYAAMERAGLIGDRGILFKGRDMITVNLGMEMRIRGKESYYTLIEAGINWYEAHHVCEFIPDNEWEIRLVSKGLAEGDVVVHSMRLPHMPARPNRASKLRMTVYFSSPTHCHVEIEDLGFGEMYKPSGLVWKREICF